MDGPCFEVEGVNTVLLPLVDQDGAGMRFPECLGPVHGLEHLSPGKDPEGFPRTPVKSDQFLGASAP